MSTTYHTATPDWNTTTATPDWNTTTKITDYTSAFLSDTVAPDQKPAPRVGGKHSKGWRPKKKRNL